MQSEMANIALIYNLTVDPTERGGAKGPTENQNKEMLVKSEKK